MNNPDLIEMNNEHVEIVFDNIEEGQAHNFEIQPNVDPAGTPYDLLSIMYYSPTAFSKNGEPTIIAKDSGGDQFGTTEEPTDTDVYELNVAYQYDMNTGVESDTDDGSEYVTVPDDGFEYVNVIYEDYDNVYADDNFTSVIDLINYQF